MNNLNTQLIHKQSILLKQATKFSGIFQYSQPEVINTVSTAESLSKDFAPNFIENAIISEQILDCIVTSQLKPQLGPIQTEIVDYSSSCLVVIDT